MTMTTAALDLEHRAGLLRARNPALSIEKARAEILAQNPQIYAALVADETQPRRFVAPAPVSRAGSHARDLVQTEINRRAADLRRADPSLSPAAAEAKVLRESPALYARYVEATELDTRKK